MTKKNKIIHFTIFAFIIILAIILRIYNIDNTPSGIYPDEANNGTNAYDAQLNGEYQWFYPDNNGREGLYLNFIAIGFKFFDVSTITLKLPSIIMGILTVIGVYLLSRELFISKPRLALIASYLTAVSFWAVNFSRIAFRAIMMLPILTFSFYFIFRGIRTNRWWNFALGGFIFGLGFHTYIAFRIAPTLLIVLLILLLLQQGFTVLKKHWKNLIIFTLFVLVSAAPIFYTFHTHPEFLNSRTNDVSIFANNENGLVPALTETITTSLLKFNVYGDQNWRHGYPPQPTLEFFVGLMFVGGIILSTIIFFTYLIRRLRGKTNNRKLVTHGLLLAWFIAFLAPEFLTTEGLPHALRSIGVIPVVYILAAFFINFLIERSEKLPRKMYVITFALIITLLIISGFCNILKYHKHWATDPRQAQSFNKNLTDIAKHIKTLPQNSNKYVIAGPLERLPVKLLNETTPNLYFLYENEINKIDTSKDFYVLMSVRKDDVIDTLSSNTDISTDTIITDLNTKFIIIKSIQP
ncbi:MAG TPA: glycosyltransferase family 39 protein [Candidatus Pacebacteria bacterium]|nr:glycosyltransferase family 39 protein [Candidatus Paceibacterota bacterium]